MPLLEKADIKNVNIKGIKMRQYFLKKNVIFFYFFMVATSFVMADDDDSKVIYGRYERVVLPTLNSIKMKAKLDTGALTSSLGATDIELYKKSGKNWVRFRVLDDESKTVYEYPVKKISKIKRRIADACSDEDVLHTERPVIELPVCLGNKKHSIDVNLSDRSNFEYNFLMGANALITFGAVVDPSEKFQSKVLCK